MVFTIIWAVIKAIFSGEISSWYHAYEQNKKSGNIANAPLDKQELEDSFK